MASRNQTQRVATKTKRKRIYGAGPSEEATSVKGGLGIVTDVKLPKRSLKKGKIKKSVAGSGDEP